MERIYSLQGLRGLAVLGVVLFHMTSVEQKYGGGDRLLPAVLDFFQLGVDLFFIISGFVMVIVSRGRFQDRRQTRRFLFNRVARVYPTYWLYYALTLAVVWVQPSWVNASHGDSSLLLSFLLLPNDKVLLVMVAWSLLFELWFYLVFSALMGFRERWLPAFLVGWSLALVGFNLFQNWGNYNATLRLILHPYALEFIMGVALALFSFSRHSPRVPTWTLATLMLVALIPGVAAIGYFRVFDEQGLLRMLVVSAVFGTVIVGAVLLEQRSRLFIPRMLVAIGDMSYTVYLSHLLVLGAIGKLWQWIGPRPDTLLDNALLCVLMLAAVVCYGWVGYRGFEKPILDRANQFSRRHWRVDGIGGRA